MGTVAVWNVEATLHVENVFLRIPRQRQLMEDYVFIYGRVFLTDQAVFELVCVYVCVLSCRCGCM